MGKRGTVKRGENRDSESDKNLVLNEDLALIRLAILNYKKRYNISDKKILDIVSESLLGKHDILLPVSIFKRELGVLESIVKYLKENLKMRNSEISKLINRDNRTIWASYANSLKKYPDSFASDDEKRIPLIMFSERKAGALELLSLYMHDQMNLSFTEAGRRIGRNSRTIWTSYQKGKKKVEDE